ncbi:MAG TPA: hypothetical protein VFM72_07265 [Aequorivita sp.]|nr:hypothetical protein [Aequorivita sp.]
MEKFPTFPLRATHGQVGQHLSLDFEKIVEIKKSQPFLKIGI